MLKVPLAKTLESVDHIGDMAVELALLTAFWKALVLALDFARALAIALALAWALACLVFFTICEPFLGKQAHYSAF